MAEVRFDNQSAVITGGGGGLGRAYALYLASRGAAVLVNDVNIKAANSVVQMIVENGGKAATNYDSVEDGQDIIAAAVNAFGRLDILINSAGILRDVSFGKMTDRHWDDIIAVHVKGKSSGLFKCTQAAFKIFRQQNYGRIIMTSSSAGLFGNFGQCNYSAAKLGTYGFTETLAKEGVKYNILCNAIAPVAASQMTATVMSADLLRYLSPDFVAPLVALLVHSSSTETGSIFEVGAGHISKFRWERSRGIVLKCDKSLTPSAVLKKWAEINDFSNPDYPTNTADMVKHLNTSRNLASNEQGEPVRFDGKVAVVTGGGAGLGRAYCTELARLGAAVVVNDLMDPETVVKEIRAMGGKAVGSLSSVEDGAAIIKTAIDAFGKVDILINNAGILRDKAFINMTEEQWDKIMNVHLRGTYACTRAAYPYMVKQKYGRIVNTASTSGIYGNYGQTNYATAKMAILGFSRALAQEGRRNNIFVTTIAPSAGTNLTRSVLSQELVEARKPEYAAGLVLLLCSDKLPNPGTAGLFEVGCGWQGRTRWQRSGGHSYQLDEMTPEAMRRDWHKITTFDDGRADNPETNEDGRKKILPIAIKRLEQAQGKILKPAITNPYLVAIEAAKKAQDPPTEFNFTEKDVILYNISLGATTAQLSLTYEQSPHFRVLPTYGVIIPYSAGRPFNIATIVPNYSYKMQLHGEQYLEIRKWPIPTSARVLSNTNLLDVIDKGNAAVVVTSSISRDALTGEDLFYSESSLFLRGSGGFGGDRQGRTDRGRATLSYKPPSRIPDLIAEELTSKDQAALYRLNGDKNPLHIDPLVAKAAGFKDGPILHGLCSFGICAKHVLANYGEYKNIKVRFAGTVLPGQTMQTEMWNESGFILFQCRVKETGKLCIAGGGAELVTTNSKL